MHGLAVIGAQWGDEGKGKIVDYLAAEAAVVVRYSGGNNAGHTVVVGDRTLKLHLIPSGILHEHVLCVIGNGTVVDLEVLADELDRLAAQGVAADNVAHLRSRPRAHALPPRLGPIGGGSSRPAPAGDDGARRRSRLRG
jgi:Adenylosuccinate synthase